LQAQIPVEVSFQPKPGIALGLLDEAKVAGIPIAKVIASFIGAIWRMTPPWLVWLNWHIVGLAFQPERGITFIVQVGVAAVNKIAPESAAD